MHEEQLQKRLSIVAELETLLIRRHIMEAFHVVHERVHQVVRALLHIDELEVEAAALVR